jgi:hypothetical protein
MGVLRLHILLPLAVIATVAAEATAQARIDLARPPALMLRFGVLCAVAAISLIVWGRFAARDAPRHWARRRAAAIASRYIELAVIAAVALIPFVHCSIVATRVTIAWSALVQETSLEAVRPLPPMPHMPEQQRQEIVELSKRPLRMWEDHRVYLSDKLFELQYDRCGRPDGVQPFDRAAAERCAADFYDHPPKTVEEKE